MVVASAAALALALAGCARQADAHGGAVSRAPSGPGSGQAAASPTPTERAQEAAPDASPTDPAVVAPAALETPVTIIEIGDSLGEDLGYGLRDVLAGAGGVTLVQAAKGNSGLVQPQYYDWPRHLHQLLAQHKPAIVVVFIGANDVQNFYADGVLQRFGTPGWRAAYGERVAALMREAVDVGARMLWVGMPVMRSAVFSDSMRQLNAVYQDQAQAHSGVTYFSSWELFSGADGKYTNTTTDDAGRAIVLRSPDGIHVAFGSGGGGADYLAAAVLDELRGRYGLQIS